MNERQQQLDLIKTLVAKVKRAGADQVDAFFEWGRNTEVTARDGEIENLKQSVSNGVGLRVFRDHRLGFGFTSDLSSVGLSELGERVMALAKETAADENNGLPAPQYFKLEYVKPDIHDPAVAEVESDWLLKTAIAMEKEARGYDPRVQTCEEVGAGTYIAHVALVNSEGFVGEYDTSYLWTVAGVVAEQNGQKQSGYYFDLATHRADLKDPLWVARTGAWKAVSMLGARKIPSGEMPVIFEPDMAKGFVRNLLSALNGDLAYKKSTFLVDKLDAAIASPAVTVIDDGTLPHRSGSRPFDGEGLPVRRQVLVDKGVLKQFVYDAYTANKAGAKPTGTASRSYQSLPGIGSTNVMLEPGAASAAELRKGIERGLLVTSMMGQGANVVNGDYSRGANGMLIEHGELTMPVQEITVSGNMLQMLQDIDAVGNDIDWRGSVGAPSIRFRKLTVSGR